MALEEDAEEPEEEVGVRVLLVEDHAAFRDALASTFQAEGFEVVGQAGSLKQAQSILEDSDHPKVRQTRAISARCRREQSSPSGLETVDR
jgi:CheY-like chemotaxis protein